MTPSFDEFFVAANDGRSPFPWQQRLADALVSNEIPDWIIAPTGLGKTAIIDAWAYALARSIEADRIARAVPTRLIFVVNRRGIIDDATRRGEALLSALTTEIDRAPALLWADQMLRSAGVALDAPLAVTRMRGGVSWDWLWLRQPDQPAIVAATVDQFGSRLLFRGYGVNPKFHSIDTALVAHDALVVLDEAHMSQPLVDTIHSVTTAQRKAPIQVLPTRPLRLVRMTATPPAPALREGADVTLSFDQADTQHPAAGLRLGAVKLVGPIVVESDKKTADDRVAQVADTVTRKLLSQTHGPAPTGIVILNTVRLARNVAERLRAHSSLDVALLVGSSRPFERDQIEETWRRRVGADRDRTIAAKPFVLVATQTVEVGADIDADVLVTEACSLDALIQRLGRLDRLGIRSAEHGKVRAVALFNEHRHADPTSRSYPIYEGSSSALFQQLVLWAGGAETVPAKQDALLDGPVADLGPVAVQTLLDRIDTAPLTRTPLRAPVLLPGVVRTWAQTSPIPIPDVAVTPYLHGPGRADSEVTICWRDLGEGLPLGDLQEAELVGYLTAISPNREELVSVKAWDVAQFLFKNSADSPTDDGDIEGASPPSNIGRQRVAQRRFAYRSGADWELVRVDERCNAESVFHSDVVVIDASAGGHDDWSWNPTHEGDVPVLAELGLAAHSFANFGDLLLLSARRLNQLGFGSPADSFVGTAIGALAEGRSDDAWEAIRELNATVNSNPDPVRPGGTLHTSGRPNLATLQRRFAERLNEITSAMVLGAPQGGMALFDIQRNDEPTETNEILVLGVRQLPGRLDPATLSPNDDTADGSSRTARSEVTLDAHLANVEIRCREIAEGLGLAHRLGDLCVLAAKLHDIGKADVRFQTILCNGDWVRAELAGQTEQLAKSGPGPRGSRSDVPVELRWPVGLRHEAVSAWMLEDSQGWHEQVEAEHRSLVTHLVGSHHGYNRPLFAPVADPSAGISITKVEVAGLSYETSSRASSIDWEKPAGFEQLNYQYSPWGLAYLEAIVRFADLWVSSEGS